MSVTSSTRPQPILAQPSSKPRRASWPKFGADRRYGAMREQGFPMIAAVGQGASRERTPRLIELSWGKERA